MNLLVGFCFVSMLIVTTISAKEAKKEHRYAYDAIGERNSMDFKTGGHWFNCGPTGIRAKIENERPTEFEVTYIFKDSPANKKILVGDRIIGANGKTWKEKDPLLLGAHTSFGYYGPRRMLGLAIEESESKKGSFSGKLSLIVMRDGNKMTIDIPWKPIGQFGPNFPYDCEKSKILIKDACEFLIEHANPQHRRWQGHGHVQYMALMGLLAQGDEYKRFIKEFINANYSDRPSGDDSRAWTWTKAMDGVMAAELYLATKDRHLIPYMEDLDKWYTKARTPWGAYKHHPYLKPGIGYGPMAHPTAITCTAWALFKRCGIEIDKESYMESRHLIDYLTRSNGSIGYGAALPEGVESVPTVVKLKKGKPESGNIWRSFGACGYATMFHYLDPLERYSDYYVKRGVKSVIYCKELIPDGHASSSMSLFAGFMTAALAPAVGRDDIYREFLDYYKAWLNVNRCHDGSFYGRPNRDVNQDGYTGTRFNTTGAVLVLLSAPKCNLRIMGKDEADPKKISARMATPTKKAAPAVAPKPVRKARSLNPAKQAILDKALKSTLSKLSENGALTQVPLRISPTKSRVWLKEAAGEELIFQIVGGAQTAAFQWGNLRPNDHVKLALLLAELKPNSKDVQAMAAMYLESIGLVAKADQYFNKAGKDARGKFEKLFN